MAMYSYASAPDAGLKASSVSDIGKAKILTRKNNAFNAKPVDDGHDDRRRQALRLIAWLNIFYRGKQRSHKVSYGITDDPASAKPHGIHKNDGEDTKYLNHIALTVIIIYSGYDRNYSYVKSGPLHEPHNYSGISKQSSKGVHLEPHREDIELERCIYGRPDCQYR